MASWQIDDLSEKQKALLKPEALQQKTSFHMQAKARKANGSGLNKTEILYQQNLEYLRFKGQILDFKAKPFKLNLAHNTTYEPDFVVVMPDETLEVHEVKGFLEDDASVKFKLARELFPWFKFRMMSRNTESGEWYERLKEKPG